ncbi:type II toxin-antitoxin system death-on-curing family toxin [Pseudonocardia sp. KRD-184]|uniref:Type II toxin-antitoxin system death-on-curing family toxin n=1 Tax=Pseudonocardia oceani TaxID=2792013 RepID=A0ABS6U3P6_9PSEU|nr:Fic family protein [Pseudonocardia oceani]MBW0092903.1 type II toxin-antitoxin system death-on-curing family toxin [Pseudonocardia oceani]MBW0098090.1 type II toxin-antitoxin system death-on-curing family toxin [Pseudonocardia oceani]MBW0112357.1 type II toxin-antitoxin system death-on-curing family toxin [Pseudonocardia oceani]MBW0124705.1 type II toxin-antitoxin system death-on-curing family toxin [Pseudonocardia oceani]MBW0126872.1 type II toxin-antitoxin system death-on-curing family to
MTEFLTLDDLLVIAEIAIGGEVAVRDHGLLASAVARPQTTVFGEDAYLDLPMKAAALLHSLAGNHALVDGNRRLAWLATYTFLDINGLRMITTDDEVVEFVVAVAAGEVVELSEIAARLASWT